MINFSKATSRNTPCYSLHVAGVHMVISYETVIAVNDGKTKLRRINDWGPTTGRHMKDARVYDWPQLNEREFEAELERMIHEAVLSKTIRRLE